MIRVLVADDHPVVREGVRRVLEGAPDIRVVAEAASGGEVASAVTQASPDVVLLDIAMPGPDFLDVLASIPQARSGTRTLILSAHAEEEFAVRAIRAGAAGYLTKGYQPQDLVEAVRRVAAGRRYISAELAERLAMGLAGEGEAPRHEKLSNREFEVLRLIAAGKSLKEIAGELGINAKTVSSFRARLLSKLDLKTNADLVRYALQHDLIK
jgi:DNA-binding NarL/FixJ family response regulator